MDLRAYAAALRRVEGERDASKLPNTPLINEVRTNQVLLQAAALTRWGQDI